MGTTHRFYDAEIGRMAQVAKALDAKSMATAPAFAATPNLGLGITPATAIPSLTAPTGATVLWTAGSNGGRVDIIRIMQIVSTSGGGLVAGQINLFLLRSGTYYLFDVCSYAPFTLSSTVEGQPVDIYYNALVLDAGDEICVANTVASGTGATAATHAVSVMGGSF